MFSFKINSLKFSNGSTIPLEAGSLLFLIGPNNCGKTVTLKSIEAHIRPGLTYSNKFQVISDVNTDALDSAVVRDWLTRNFRHQGEGEQLAFRTVGGSVTDRQIDKLNMTALALFLCHRIGTEHRLQLVGTKDAIRVHEESPSAYIHSVQASDELQQKLSRLTRQAFNVDLIPNWGGGRQVWFHVGDEPERSGKRDRVSDEYLADLNRLPRLDDEGDGIRSFVGTILALHCDPQPILLIDEPEAFLHGPQARRLGATIAEAAKRNRQVIVATHSPDIVQGAVAVSDDVMICRLTRDGGVNSPRVLQKSELKKLWSRPLLRSTGATAGLFHEGVVVCEAHADSQFYEAALRNLEGVSGRPADIYFANGEGIGSIRPLTESYAALGVPIAVIADLDLLLKRSEFISLYKALGGKEDRIESNYATVCRALDNLPRLDAKKWVHDGRALLDTAEKMGTVDDSTRRGLRKLAREGSARHMLKQHGTRLLKSTDLQAAESLLSECARTGLFLVPVGELEGWWRKGPSRKDKWIAAAFEEMESKPEEFREAIEFVSKIAKVLGYYAV